MPAQTLEVLCFGKLAGTLTDTREGMVFDYDDRWLAARRSPLSQSLPLGGGFGPDQASAFFGGLLPEGEPRAQLARQLGVSPRNDFALLALLGGDTAGAISVVSPGQLPPAPGTDVEWLDDAGIAALIDELPRRPMHADPDGEYRLSLAGVQDKLPVIVDDDGRLGLTKGGTPSTHILKTPIERLPDTVLNEAFCLDFGRRLQIDTVAVEPRETLGRRYLLVRRYDRHDTGVAVERLHQEDFCQALGIPATRKYESEGGPGFGECFDLLRQAVAVPAREAPRMLDYVGLSFLVGNHDAHGKNYSLLYRRDGPRAVLAPAYDVLSTIAYEAITKMSRKMAMRIGGEYRPEYVRSRHLDRMLSEAGLGVAPSRRRLRALASQAPRAASDTRAALAAKGWDAPILAQVQDIIERRAEALTLIAAPARSSRPVTSSGK